MPFSKRLAYVLMYDCNLYMSLVEECMGNAVRVPQRSNLAWFEADVDRSEACRRTTDYNDTHDHGLVCVCA